MTAVGSSPVRVDGPDKVTGRARYAVEHPVDAPLSGWLVQATVAVGEVRDVDDAAALEVPGVVHVLHAGNAPRLADPDDPELAVLQGTRVSYRGQVVAMVLAESLEAAREGARAVRVTYDEQPHDVQLTRDHPRRYAPEDADVSAGDLARRARRLGPPGGRAGEHACRVQQPDGAARHDGAVGRRPAAGARLHAGHDVVKRHLAAAFGVPEDGVRVLATHVGGGFGSKGSARAQRRARRDGCARRRAPGAARPDRSQQFSLVGYRSPTLQRVRLGADAEGRLTALAHDVRRSRRRPSTSSPSRRPAAAATSTARGPARWSQRLTALDVPTPRWMRAPGEAPGAFALEIAMDELAAASGIDPVELRLRNDTQVDPETGLPFSSRSLAECLRRGRRAVRLGGARPAPGRAPGRPAGWSAPAWRPRPTRSTSVPAARAPGASPTARTRSASTPPTSAPAPAPCCCSSPRTRSAPSRTASGSTSPTATCRPPRWPAARRARRPGAAPSTSPPAPCSRAASTRSSSTPPTSSAAQRDLARHAFGAQFAEVRVDLDSGEVRVPRMLGVFAVGRVVNPRTARSQLLGGMVMGLSMALHESGALDLAHGDYANADLAEYHVADPRRRGRPRGRVGRGARRRAQPRSAPRASARSASSAPPAAVLNAVWHATGVRVRDLPATPDRLLAGLPER